MLNNKIEELDNLGKLSDKHHKIWNRYLQYDDSLTVQNGIVYLSDINTIKIDNLTDEYQLYQYKKLKEITDNMSVFSEIKLRAANKDSLSYKEYYERYVDFELLRNKEMSSNY